MEAKVTPEALMVMYLDEIAGRLADLSADFKTKEVAIQSVRIAPMSEIIWDDEEIEPGTTAIIDTFGYFPIMYIKLAEPSDALRIDPVLFGKVRIVLTDVSRDGKNWRHVEEIIKEFEFEEIVGPEYAYVNLNDVIGTKEVLAYRYYKIRMDAKNPVKLTVEITSKYTGLREKPTETIISNIAKIGEILPGIERQLTRLREQLREQFANASSWDHFHKTVTSAGTPVKLSVLAVPDGGQLVVKAMHDNTGAIYLGKSEAAVKNTGKRVTLSKKSESTTFKVTNADLIWVDVEVDGEGVEYWSEKK